MININIFKNKEERKKLKEQRKKKREEKNVRFAKSKKKDNYLSKGALKKKIQNAQVFTNVKEITDNGLIKLKTNQVALFYKVSPIDLSLTNDNEQKMFFYTLSKLYRLPFTIKAYKFDEKINLNINKENYEDLIEKTSNLTRKNILVNNHNFIETIEEENMTSASSYYFAIITNNLV